MLVCQAMRLSAAPCHKCPSLIIWLYYTSLYCSASFAQTLALSREKCFNDEVHGHGGAQAGAGPSSAETARALKRSKSKKKDDVKYVRTVSHTAIRADRVKWRRSLPELLAATDFGIIRLLQKDKILPQWSGHKNAHAAPKELFHLYFGGETYAYRRRAKGCQCCVNPQHLHPLFVEYDGGNGRARGLQSADASCFCWFSTIARMLPSTALLHIGHKAIEEFETRLRQIRQKYVGVHEKKILFGHDAAWHGWM